MQRSNARKPFLSTLPLPIRWAALLFSLGLLSIIVVGLLRTPVSSGLYAAAPTVVAPQERSATSRPEFTEPIIEGPKPAWSFVAPRIRPLGSSRQALLVQPTSTPLPLPTATPVVVTPTQVPQAQVPQVNVQPQAASVKLDGLRHYWQTWNNCGPATLAMNLSYFGSPLDQAVVGTALRRNPDDKNVTPQELAAFARSQGYLAQVRVNGSAELARTLLSNGIPLLLHTWLEEEPNDGMGHYRLLVGYDDAQANWIVYDSYVSTNLISTDPATYSGIYMPYDLAADRWKVFNYSYVLVYPPEQEALVQSILGASYETAVMWQESAVRARVDVATAPNDAFAHFNLGTNYVAQSNYAEAALAFDQARAIGLPWRMLWYQFELFEAYFETGRYQEVIDLSQATLNSAGGAIEELHYWQGRAQAALGNTDAAQVQWRQALTLNPDFAAAQNALQGLNAN